MQKRIKLIANPVSGGDARPRIEQARLMLEDAGARVDLYLTGKRGDAREVAALLNPADYDLVLAAGGDGTLTEVTNGLVGRGLPLAFLPLGTANVMALEMRIPPTVAAACQIALAGRPRSVTLAEIDGSYFLMMAGVGIDAAAVRAVDPQLKRRAGKFAYLVAGLRALAGYREIPLQLRNAAGETLTVWHVIISNIRLYGGRFLMAPEAGLETPELTACVVDRPGRWALLLFFLRVFLAGRFLGAPRRLKSTSFCVDGGSVPVQVDGDDYGDTPVKISCHSELLTLIFPD